MTQRVVEIKSEVATQPLSNRQLSRVVVRRRQSCPGSQSRVLGMYEHIVQKCDRSIVPLQLTESVVGKPSGYSTDAWIRDALTRALCGGQSPNNNEDAEVASKTGQDIFKKWNWRNRRHGRYSI